MSTIGGRRRAGPAPMPAVSWPVWSGSAPALTEFFSPRPETGSGLEASPGDPAYRGQDDQHPLTLLVGPNGYGKTHLAAAMLRGAARAGQTDLHVWVNASSPSAVVMGYARAAADVGIADRAMAPDAAAARFLDWLGRTERQWMIVLDNVTDSAGLRGLWPPAPPARSS